MTENKLATGMTVQEDVLRLRVESEQLKEEKKMLIKRLKTLIPCGYCVHLKTEPDDLCIPCLSGIKSNYKVGE